MWRRIAFIALLPFVSLDLRPIVGCGLAAMSIILFQEVLPYHDPATNSLAVAAQWQVQESRNEHGNIPTSPLSHFHPNPLLRGS